MLFEFLERIGDVTEMAHRQDSPKLTTKKKKTSTRQVAVIEALEADGTGPVVTEVAAESLVSKISLLRNQPRLTIMRNGKRHLRAATCSSETSHRQKKIPTANDRRRRDVMTGWWQLKAMRNQKTCRR